MKWVGVVLLIIPVIVDAQDLMKDLDQVEQHLRRSEYQIALDSAKKIAGEAEKTKNVLALARANYLISDALYYLGDFKTFEYFARKAVEGYLKANDTEGIAKSYYQLSFMYERDQSEEMIRMLDKANAYAERTDVLWLRAVIQNAYGVAYQNLDNYRLAALHFETSAKIAEQAKDQPKQSIALSNAGTNWSYLGDYQKALMYFNKALALSKQSNNKRSLAVVLGQRGGIQLTLGDTDDALVSFREALALNEQSGYRKGQLWQLQNIADVYMQLGETDEFLEYSEKALVIADEIEHRFGYFYTLNRITEALIRENRFAEAEEYLKRTESNAISSEIENRNQMALMTRASLHLKLSNFSEAHKSVDRMLPLAEEINDLNALGRGHGMKARIFEKEGKIQNAIVEYRKAIDIYEPMGILRELTSWCGRIAELSVKVGNEKEAERYYQKSLEYINKLDSILIMDRFRINLFKDVSDIYQSYAHWLASRGLIEQAWNVLEQGRTRDLTLRIAQAQDSVSLSPKEQDALSRLSVLQRSLREEELSKSERANLLKKISTAETQYEEAVYIAQSAKDSSRTAQYKLRFPEQNSLFIEYALHNNEILIFSRANNSINFRKVSQAESVLQKVNTFHQQSSLFTEKINDTTLARQLFQILLQPELRSWPQGSILIIPDDVLNFLPFAALITDGSKYLIEDYAVSTVPSLEILNRLYDRNRMTQEKSAAIANTTFQFSKNSPFPLPSLPGTEKEGEMFVRKVKGAVLLLNENESRIKKTDFSDFRLMHFATHTLINEAHPERSSIVLAASADEDGYLQAREIYRMRLAEIAVLSGCRSGTGKIVSGEGLVGLSHAFFAAGTRTLITSLWDVSDEATVEFMNAFYDALDGNSVGTALKEAQNKMIHSRKWKHPGYWSSFTISGVAAEKIQIAKTVTHSVAYYSGIAVLLIAALLVLRGIRSNAKN